MKYPARLWVCHQYRQENGCAISVYTEIDAERPKCPGRLNPFSAGMHVMQEIGVFELDDGEGGQTVGRSAPPDTSVSAGSSQSEGDSPAKVA